MAIELMKKVGVDVGSDNPYLDSAGGFVNTSLSDDVYAFDSLSQSLFKIDPHTSKILERHSLSKYSIKIGAIAILQEAIVVSNPFDRKIHYLYRNAQPQLTIDTLNFEPQIVGNISAGPDGMLLAVLFSENSRKAILLDETGTISSTWQLDVPNLPGPVTAGIYPLSVGSQHYIVSAYNELTLFTLKHESTVLKQVLLSMRTESKSAIAGNHQSAKFAMRMPITGVATDNISGDIFIVYNKAGPYTILVHVKPGLAPKAHLLPHNVKEILVLSNSVLACFCYRPTMEGTFCYLYKLPAYDEGLPFDDYGNIAS